MAYFLAAVLLVYAAINYYLLKRTSQALDGTGTFRTIILWAVFVLALSYPFGMIAERFFHSGITKSVVTAGSFYLGVMFYGCLVAALIDLVRVGSRFFSCIPFNASTGRVAWLAAAVIIISIVIIGHFVAAHPRLRTVDLTMTKNAAGLTTLSIVAVSDMHLGTVVGIGHLQRIMTLVKAADPDIVLLAGDIFDADVSDEMEREIAGILSGIRTRYGVYAVTGNHEYYAGVEKAVSNLTRGNVTVLQDTALRVADAFYLIGRKDLTAQRMGTGRKPLEEICAGLDRTVPLILMDHQPFHLEAAQTNGIDLQVSGHTHNAQLFPLNLFYGLIYEKSSGFLKKGNTAIVVSCGAGTWGPPVRTSSISEVVQIRLHFPAAGATRKASGSAPSIVFR
jgi:predicted MPP superfamily phosphohydrolase